jgi:hypothetical protein
MGKVTDALFSGREMGKRERERGEKNYVVRRFPRFRPLVLLI